MSRVTHEPALFHLVPLGGDGVPIPEPSISVGNLYVDYTLHFVMYD